MVQTRNGVSSQGRATEANVDGVWLRGARLLSEQGRLAWLLGEGLQAVLAGSCDGGQPQDAPTVAARCQQWVRTAVSAFPGLDASTPINRVVPSSSSAGSTSPRKASPAHGKHRSITASWTQLIRRRLDDRVYPVVFVGSQRVRGAWASLALGVDLNGTKHVLATREGAQGEQLIPELAARGMMVTDGVLVVTDGSRALDNTVGQTWPGRAQLQHCLYRLRHDLRAHLPASEHATVDRHMASVATLDPAEAGQALQALLAHLRVPHPGAARRLERSIEPTLTVARLGVAPPLRDHVQIQGLLRVACERAVAQGRSPAPGLEAIAAGMVPWLERTRRLVGRTQLPQLARQLRQAVQGTER